MPESEIEATRRLSIIIPIHNAHDETVRCLRSVERYHGRAEVVLVDDGSTDPRIPAVLVGFADRNAWKLVRRPTGSGHSLACAAGVNASSRSLLCFLNSDTVVTPWSWAGIVAAFESDEGVAIVGPSVSLAGTPQRVLRACRCRHFWTDERVFGFAGMYVRRQPPRAWTKTLLYIDGCAFFVRRTVWDELGGFAPDRPHYGNEVELCARARSHGWILVWTKNSYIHHTGGASHPLRRETLVDQPVCGFAESTEPVAT